MPLKKWVTVLFMITALGCTSARKPSWVAQGIHPGYTPDRFLMGLGLSSRSRDTEADVQKADTNARLEVARQLKVNIESHITSRQEQKTGSFLPERYTSKRVVDVTEEVHLLLEGITIVDRYYSEKDHLHYSIAVLNRSETAKRLSSEMDRHSHHIHALSRQSDSLLGKGDIVGALHKKIRALDHYRHYISKRQMVAVLNSQASEGADVPFGDPYEGVVDIKNSIELLSLGGDMQAGRVGRGLARPLRVKAMYKGKIPIGTLPLMVRFRDGAGRTERNMGTGRDGTAEIKVLELEKTGRHLNPVTVSVDWDRFLQEALGERFDTSWEDAFSGPSAHFKYTLRVPGTSRVLIKVCHQGGASSVDALSILHPMSVDRIKDQGFLIKKEGGKRRDGGLCSGAQGIESIVRKYRPFTDILVVEKIDVDFSSRRGTGYVFRAKMSLTAYDMAHHEIMASMEGEALGGARHRKTAAERAIKAVAGDLIPQLVSRIAEGL